MMITWPMLKSFMDVKKVYPQIFEDANTLLLILVDGTLKIGCQLNKSIDKEYIEDFDTNYRTKSNPKAAIFSSPFAINKIDGKSLALKVHGVSVDCSVGANDFIFAIPYNECKIYGIQIVGASDGDTCNFSVLDSEAGTYTGVPNYQIDQYGFNVGVNKNFHEQISPFERGLFIGLQLKMVLTATVAKKISVNFLITEATPL